MHIMPLEERTRTSCQGDQSTRLANPRLRLQVIDPTCKMSQEAAIRIRGQRDIPAKRAPAKARVPMAQNVPPPEEENPRVKCRDCGAFGHTWRSKTCPIKFGYGLLVPQPLGGSRKAKENQDPGRSQAPQTPATANQAERDKKLRQHRALQEDRQCSKGSLWAPGKKAFPGPTQPGQNPPKKARLASRMRPEQSPAGTLSTASSAESQPPFLARGLGAKEEAARSNRVAAQVPSMDRPQLQGRAALVSEGPCTESQAASAARVAGPALRMIFSRQPGDRWACRFLTAAPGHPERNQTPPPPLPPLPESPASLEKGEGPCSQVPWSVLYEDLLVSSSSEDSDGE